MSDAATGRAATPPVRAEGVQRTFVGATGLEIRVLRGVDLVVVAGETVAIVGPSGAGKSTLLHALGGLDVPTAGRVLLGGRDISLLPDEELASIRNRFVGFVFQFHHLLRDFTALENVMMPQLIMGTGRKAARDRARALLDQVGLSERLEHRPARLSGGEQQRVAVARALANEPPVLLADEPSGNLDRETSERLHDLLFDLAGRHGTALIVVTHNASLAARTDRVLELRDGTLRPRETSEAVTTREIG
ncbi:MAG: ABC transporter ATP-binding protein [Gemmatimonadota bacterium]|nr:ABC transporter ATP-binding protein [Gemmatimonadota bacterium]